MADMNHTPGPWIIEPHDPTARGHWLHDSKGSFVCLAVKRDDGGPSMELANARLIAAAPEMLALIRVLLDNDVTEQIADSGEVVIDMWKHEAAKLIAKMERSS